MAVKKNSKKTPAKKSPPSEAGFCVYLGPSITGLLQTGSIFKGTRAEVLERLAYVTEKYPEIVPLVVTGDTLPEDRIKVKTPGNLLYEQYRKVRPGKK